MMIAHCEFMLKRINGIVIHHRCMTSFLLACSWAKVEKCEEEERHLFLHMGI